MCFALNDQKMVNEMNKSPKYVQKLMCNDINKRFPSLPLMARGSYHEYSQKELFSEKGCSLNTTTDDDDENLAPGKCLRKYSIIYLICFELSGLSHSVCTELLKGISKHSEETEEKLKKQEKLKTDDISHRCCVHFILKDLCHLCRNDPDSPKIKKRQVWRETIDSSKPSAVLWKKESRIDKVSYDISECIKNCMHQYICICLYNIVKNSFIFIETLKYRRLKLTKYMKMKLN